MTLQNVGIIVSLVAGIGGLILGVLNIVQNYRDKKPHMRVTLRLGTLLSPVGETASYFSVKGVNTGQRLISVAGFGILLPNGHNLVTAYPTLGQQPPKDLLGGQSFEGYLDARQLARQVKANGYGPGVRIQGYIRDAEDKLYRSHLMEFDPDRWLTSDGDRVS